MASSEVLQRLESRATTAEQLIAVLKMQVAQIKTSKSAGPYDDQVEILNLQV
jgi:FtsZ-binding cell division protein ZapB